VDDNLGQVVFGTDFVGDFKLAASGKRQ